MIGAGLMLLAVAGVFAVLGGWAGWIFAVIFAVLAGDLLLDARHARRMRREWDGRRSK